MATMIYISLSWAGFLTLLSARNDGPFWTAPPGAHLLCAFAFSVTATALIGGLLKVYSFSMNPNPSPNSNPHPNSNPTPNPNP
jgi:hypothetical protein